MICFDTTLQQRVRNLFSESLVYNGFLCLGEYEEIAPGFIQNFRRITDRARIFQFKSGGSRPRTNRPRAVARLRERE